MSNFTRCRLLISVVVSVAAITLPTAAFAVVPCDGALNSQPDAQQWVFVPNGTHARSVGSGVTALDTTADTSALVGYFSFVPLLGAHPEVPVIDLTASDWSINFFVECDLW